MENLICNFYITKWKDQYYIFNTAAFVEVQGPFHTSELAHLWLIERAKELSTDKINVACLEVEKEFIFIQTPINEGI